MTAAPPLISLRDVGKTHVLDGGGRVEALRGVSLDIHAGEFVSIMGASGSGKSTLLNLLGGLDRPTQGSIRFRGVEISKADADTLARLRRREIGFIFQGYNLLPAVDALDNAALPGVYAGLRRSQRHARAVERLTRLGLAERLHHTPNQLSGGQQQRVSVARALLNGGAVLLADEPTGALDSRSGAELVALLKELAAQGHTIILVTHDRTVAEHAQRIIEMRDGEIVADSGRATVLPAPLPAAPEVRRSTAAICGEAASGAVSALRRHMFRTFLTLLGTMIGVAAVTAMVGVGEWSRREVRSSFFRLGTNTLSIFPGGANQRFAAGGSVQSLLPLDADNIRRLPGVRAAVPIKQTFTVVRAGGRDMRASIVGATVDLPEVRDWDVARGAFFTEEDQTASAAVAVIGSSIAELLFGGEDPIGGFLLIDRVAFEVVGVMTPRGAGWGPNEDETVLVPLPSGVVRLFGAETLNQILVKVDSTDQMPEVETALIRTMLERRGGNVDFTVRNNVSLVETASASQRTMTVLLAVSAAISLLVGGIGIMNIMLVSVIERTREIGIRVSVGASRSDILMQFMIEAVLVSAIGGAAGLALGWGAVALLPLVGTGAVFVPQAAAIAFAVGLATGFVFAIAPAWRASRLDPVAALGRE
jgi:macrolide transport system ATP-binding/permease protein